MRRGRQRSPAGAMMKERLNSGTDAMKAVALGLIKIYRAVLSPYMPGQCRFYPTCSEYAADAVQAHGVLRGSWMAARRLARCRPGAKGGYDPAVAVEEAPAETAAAITR